MAAAELAEELVGLAAEPQHYRTGFWLEAVRIGSITGDRSIPGRRGWRRTVERLETAELPASLDGAVAVVAGARQRSREEVRAATERLLAALADGQLRLEPSSDATHRGD